MEKAILKQILELFEASKASSKSKRKSTSGRSKKPSEFIKFLEEKLNEDEKKLILYKFPTYLKEFLYCIQFELDNCKKSEKESLLKKYENSIYFLEKIEKKLDVSLRRYLTIYEDDESDDE